MGGGTSLRGPDLPFKPLESLLKLTATLLFVSLAGLHLSTLVRQPGNLSLGKLFLPPTLSGLFGFDEFT